MSGSVFSANFALCRKLPLGFVGQIVDALITRESRTFSARLTGRERLGLRISLQDSITGTLSQRLNACFMDGCFFSFTVQCDSHLL